VYAVGGRRDEWKVDVTMDSTETSHPDAPEAHERREGSARRIVITIFLVVTLSAIFVQNMPTSVTKAGLIVAAQPYLNLTGLDQGWSIFSPNPRQLSVFVLARIERADGSVELRPVPTGIGPSEYWGYRWQKYGESLASPTEGRPLWRPYAEWLVEQDRQAGGKPVRVTLIRRVSSNPPPGPSADALPYVEQPFYTVPVLDR